MTEEEKQRRIASTRNHIWVQLASDVRKWNSFMRKHMGEDFPEEFKLNCSEMDDKTYSDWLVWLGWTRDKAVQGQTIDFTNCYFLENPFKLGQYCFCKPVDFRGTIFDTEVCFLSSVFFESFNFSNVQFLSHVNFNNCVFYGGKFENTKFGSADFGYAKFYNGISFIGSSALKIDFREAHFYEVPRFEGFETEIIYFTPKSESFNNKKNNLSENEFELIESSSAWAALIRLMEKVHNLPMRQVFYEKLLEVDKQAYKRKDIRWLYWSYEKFGYGRLLEPPILIWCYATVIGLLCYMFASVFIGVYCPYNPLAFALKASVPFLWYDNAPVTDYLASFGNYFWLKVFVIFINFVQSIICLFSIFLIGLALRNRFRLKT